MKAEDVIDLYQRLESRGVKVRVDGGWSVDALLGRQLRPHNDLDIAIHQNDVPELLKFLNEEGYKEIRRDSDYNVVLRDEHGREIDYHAFITDDSGKIVDGIKYPDESLTGTGTINGVQVRCISAEYQVKFLAPYLHKHTWKYKPAVGALCEKFGIELPEEYKTLTTS